MGRTAPTTGARDEPLFDVHPRTGASIEVFYADRALETFGRCGAGWFWWPRWRGFAPTGSAAGPFPTRYAAYRHMMNMPTADYHSLGSAFRQTTSANQGPRLQYGCNAG
jgi:hypothetical protein